MKKTSLVFGLTLALGLSTAFAGGWNYDRNNSKKAMLFTGQAEKTSALADISNQNSKKDLLALNKAETKEVGKATIIVAQKGTVAHKATVVVTR